MHTIEQIERSARDHVAYGWSTRPWGHWNEEQLQTYYAAYDAARGVNPSASTVQYRSI